MHYIQYSDESKSKIVSEFAGPQDPDVYSNLGEVEDDDPLYLEFTKPFVAEVTDPTEKLKQFLAANPDVVKLIGG